MVTRGKKPTSKHIRLVDGTYRSDRHGPLEGDQPPATAREPLAMPRHLKGKAAVAWKRWITPANWLDTFREPSAIAFCMLWAEFQETPSRFVASRHAQMRAYMAELGLTDQRSRAVVADKPKDEFFDD